MKVLLVDVNCKVSSTGKIVYDLYEQLNKDGHEAAVAYGRGLKINEKNIYRFSSKWEVYSHALLTRITGITGYYSYFATKNLICFIEKFKPDVVHLHDLHGYFVNIGTLVAYLKKKEIKTVWTFHSEFVYTGKCGHAYECIKWQDKCGKCPNLKKYPKVSTFDFTRWMLKQKKEWFLEWNNLDIVVPSLWLKQRVEKSFIVNIPLSIIFNGSDIKKIFYPHEVDTIKQKYGITTEKIVFSAAPDIMQENKGGKWILKISERFDKNILFIIAGVKEVEQAVREKNVLRIPLIINQNKLAEYYSMADLFLLCSKRETFSMTTVEALCCGTPVVGFESGAPETIAICEYSEFTPYGDIESIVRSIDKWIYYKSTLKKQNITEKAQMLYSSEKMYKSYLRLYKGEGSL